MTLPQTTFYAAKGGQGCSTVATVAALMSAEHGPTILVGGPDVAALLAQPAGSETFEVGALTVAPTVPEDYDPSRHALIIDAGTDPDAECYGVRYLVTRPCYLALRRAMHTARPDGVVLITEPGRALDASDVAEVVGAPIRAEVATDPAVARAVDAGLLASRLPRTLTRSLRYLDPEAAQVEEARR